ncbi:hypothetical protein HAX54_005589, partial [Datura stramonium]|nr:hypothetical protein [Datura stramonium]
VKVSGIPSMNRRLKCMFRVRLQPIAKALHFIGASRAKNSESLVWRRLRVYLPSFLPNAGGSSALRSSPPAFRLCSAGDANKNISLFPFA